MLFQDRHWDAYASHVRQAVYELSGVKIEASSFLNTSILESLIVLVEIGGSDWSASQEHTLWLLTEY